MEEDEIANLFETFNAVISSAIEEKKENPKWKKKEPHPPA